MEVPMDELVPKRCNSSASALELRLFFTKPSTQDPRTEFPTWSPTVYIGSMADVYTRVMKSRVWGLSEAAVDVAGLLRSACVACACGPKGGMTEPWLGIPHSALLSPLYIKLFFLRYVFVFCLIPQYWSSTSRWNLLFKEDKKVPIEPINPITAMVGHHIDGLVQERRNSIANALELCFLALSHRYRPSVKADTVFCMDYAVGIWIHLYVPSSALLILTHWPLGDFNFNFR